MLIFFIYYFIFIIFSSAHKSSLSTRNNESYFSLFILLSFVLIVYTPIFSQNHSRDYSNYLSFFESTNNINFSVEFIYKLLKSLVYKISSNFYFFLLPIAVITFSIIFYVCWKDSEYPLLSIFLYLSYFYFTDGATTIRAGLSSAFFLFAVYNLKNNNKKSAFMACIMATLTHYTGVFSFIIFFCNKETFNVKLWIFIILLGIFISFFNFVSISNVVSIMPLPSNVKDKIEIYLALSNIDNAKKANIFSLGNLIQLVLVFFYIHKFNINNTHYILNLKLMILGYFFLCIFSNFDTVPFRLNQYFCVSEILLWPSLINMFKRIENKKIVYLITIFYGFFRVLMHFRTQTLL